MSILNEIAQHRGAAATILLSLAAAAKLTFNYAKTRAPTVADKIEPFSNPELVELRADIDARMAALGIASASGTEPK